MSNLNLNPQGPTFSKTPKQLGYHMPAEWQPHVATWLSWPHNLDTWPGKLLEKVEASYYKILEALLPHEKVKLFVASETVLESIQKQLAKRGIALTNLEPKICNTVDAWIRDYGPTYLKSKTGEKVWCKWIFNAWGGKYPDLVRDTQIFEQPQPWISEPCFKKEFILEGGSIDVNGRGTCLTTEQCLLNKNRNAGLSQSEIEIFLQEHLGVSQVLWLEEGIVGDDTDGHIDDITRFVNEDTIISAYEEDITDENFKILDQNWKRLEAARSPEGKPWNLIKLPMPKALVVEGVRLPASYANFYIANEVVLLPVYDDVNDKRAADILQECFSDRAIVSVPCRELVYGLGSIHCITQQEPA